MENQQPINQQLVAQPTQSDPNSDVNEIDFLKNAISEATKVNETNITNNLTQHFTKMIDSKFSELKKLIYGAAINLPGVEQHTPITPPTSEDLAQLALKIFNEKNQKVTK